jgi:hypothetical protein
MSPSRKKPTVGSESSDDALLESLREGYSPSSIERDLNERLIDQALSQSATSECQRITELGAPETAEPLETAHPDSSTTVERELAAQLAEALSGKGKHALADLAEALRAAYVPTPLASTLADALAREAIRRERPPNVVPMRNVSVATAALAIAAGIAFWIVQTPKSDLDSSAASAEQLVQSRSVAPLFAETFAQVTPTERIDRIYAVRSRELRHNRYAIWRVR